MDHKSGDLALTRFMLDHPPPPEGLHNPRGCSLEPTIGPVLRSANPSAYAHGPAFFGRGRVPIRPRLGS